MTTEKKTFTADSIKLPCVPATDSSSGRRQISVSTSARLRADRKSEFGGITVELLTYGNLTESGEESITIDSIADARRIASMLLEVADRFESLNPNLIA